MTGISQLLALAAALTRRAEQLCIGLEQGVADIYERVTPLTTELLRWWFGDDTCQSRRFNFHPGQRQAILNVIAAHEAWPGFSTGLLSWRKGAEIPVDSPAGLSPPPHRRTGTPGRAAGHPGGPHSSKRQIKSAAPPIRR